MAEDEDIEQDSEEYRKWRQGDDNDQYASSRTPTETGSKSGEYKIPLSTDTPISSSGDQGGDSGDRNFWIAIVVAAILVIGTGIIGISLFMGSGDGSSWPTTEGYVSETYYTDGWVEECDDENDDGYEDDWECYDVFWCKIEVSYNFTVEERKYFGSESGIDGHYGESKCQTELEGKYAVNATVTVHYNSDDPNENYIENPPSSGLAIMLCVIPIILIIVSIAVFAQRMQAASGVSPLRRRGFGGFGMFGRGARGGWRGRSSGRAKRRTTRTRSRKR